MPRLIMKELRARSSSIDLEQYWTVMNASGLYLKFTVLGPVCGGKDYYYEVGPNVHTDAARVQELAHSIPKHTNCFVIVY